MHALRGSGEDGSEYISLFLARESVALLCAVSPKTNAQSGVVAWGKERERQLKF